MKVVICGAGQVGSTIADYLSQEEGTSVSVIDNDPDVIQRINDSHDVRAILGHASHPDVLTEAGAKKADMLIAVTSQDEVNMIACQMAHTLFDVPTKIARLRHQNFLNKQYSDLFATNHMPIDYIMSPEFEVVRAIERRLSVPGAADVAHLAEGKFLMLGIACGPECPYNGSSYKAMAQQLEFEHVQLLSMIRDNRTYRHVDKMTVEEEDVVYVFLSKDMVNPIMRAFGHLEEEAHHLLIAGGNNVGTRLLETVDDNPEMSAKLIEFDKQRAQRIASKLPKSTILHGDMMDAKFLEEVGIAKADTFVAITDDDEFNIMASLLAKKYKCPRVITLLNTATYEPLVNQLGIDVSINPRSLTVSNILQHIRHRKLRSIYSVQEDFGEIMELELTSDMSIMGRTLKSANFSKDMRILAFIRQGEVFEPDNDTIFEEGDVIILYAAHTATNEISRKFSNRLKMV